MTERDNTDREEPVLVRNIEHLAMRAASQGMHHENRAQQATHVQSDATEHYP